MRKNESGVTLIALTVTIIILLILAGVSVSQLAGSNGLFMRSKQIVSDYSQTQADEESGVTVLAENLKDMRSVIRDTAASRAIIFTATPDVINSNEYTSDNVTVNVSTTELYSDTDKYEIQLSTNGSSYTAGNSQTFTQNGKLYARLVQKSDSKILGTAILTVNRIDKTAPTNALPTASSTAHTITVYNKITDAESKLTVNYRIRSAGGSWGSWQPNAIFYNLDINTTYDVQTKATDQAGHTVSNESLSGTNYTRISTLTRDEENNNANITVNVNGGGGGGGGSAGYGVLTVNGIIYKVTPSTQTRDKVTVTLSSYAPQYVVQTSLNGSTWANVNEVDFVQNGVLYARLMDPATGDITDTLAINITNIVVDNGPPVVTINELQGNLNVVKAIVTIYDDAGVDWLSTKYSITKYSSRLGLDPASYDYFFEESPATIYRQVIEGTYYLHILATDLLGNTQETITNAIDVIDHYSFTYTGKKQEISLSPGTYRLRCWGAQGGTYNGVGGKGGYSEGVITLTEITTFNIYVGGQGNVSNNNLAGAFNGGGNGVSGGAPGGGATDIRINGTSMYSRVIVAGGGGGGGSQSTATSGTAYTGGFGGGASGGDGTWYSSSYSRGYGARQFRGGLGAANGLFGYGANASGGNSGGGGGGWFGGGAGSTHGSGGGGSGCVYSFETAGNYPSGCLLDSRYYLTETKLLAGNANFTSPNGASEVGHTGNGYCIIEAAENYDPAPDPNVHDFYFTGNYQAIELPAGKYRLQVWGAQGGQNYNVCSNGGKGGYAEGQLTLTATTTLYVYVGGQGTWSNGNTGGFNGGGSGVGNGGGGGGGTDIRIGSKSLYARVIVAGAGGGNGDNGSTNYQGGVGGGTTGGTGTNHGSGYNSGSGGSQIAGGAGAGAAGIFGYGASTAGTNSGGGGGGWFGGGAGNNHGAGGGGSGYVYTSSTEANYPSGCLLSSKYHLTATTLTAGNASFVNKNEQAEIGHEGHGFARITKIT